MDKDTETGKGLSLPALHFLKISKHTKKSLQRIGLEIVDYIGKEDYLENYILLTKMQAVIEGAKNAMKDSILSEIEENEIDRAFGAKVGVSSATRYEFPDQMIQAQKEKVKSLERLAKNALNAGKLTFIDDDGVEYQAAIIKSGSKSPKITL